jgi:hypothetical protein
LSCFTQEESAQQIPDHKNQSQCIKEMKFQQQKGLIVKGGKEDKVINTNNFSQMSICRSCGGQTGLVSGIQWTSDLNSNP